MKVNLLLILAVLIQLGSATSGIASQTAAADAGGFAGSVRDSSNRPLSGVKVSAFNIGTNLHRETTTSASGEFALANLPRAIYRIHAERPGFETVIRVEPLEMETSRVTLFMPFAAVREGASADVGSVSGTVRGYDNISLKGVRISFREKAGKTLQIVSDDRGTFTLPDLAAGVWEIVAEREGFQTLRLTDVHLMGRSATQVHLKLQAVSGRPAQAANQE
jgi:hypothetical protein